MNKKRTEIGGYLEWNFNIFYNNMLISNPDFVTSKEIEWDDNRNKSSLHQILSPNKWLISLFYFNKKRISFLFDFVLFF